MEYEKIFLDAVTGKTFQDTKVARRYYFHPPMLIGDGPQVAIENTNTKMGNGLWDCYTFKDKEQMKVKIGAKKYVIEKVVIPYTNKPAEIHLSDRQGNSLRLREVKSKSSP